MFEREKCLSYIIEEMEDKKRLPILIKKECSQLFKLSVREIEEVMVEYQDFKIKEKVCNNIGHNMFVKSYGGPETGYEWGFCKRCGYNFDVTYY